MWCGPSFSLGWDKPGSVAPLRLVGCLIETPAPSWAYFYSISPLSFFSSPVLKSLLLIFVFCQLSTFALSVYLFTAVFFYGVRCVSACMHDRGKLKNLHGSVSGVDPNTHLLPPPPPLSFLLYLFYARHSPRWQELPVTGLAVSMQCIYSK